MPCACTARPAVVHCCAASARQHISGSRPASAACSTLKTHRRHHRRPAPSKLATPAALPEGLLDAAGSSTGGGPGAVLLGGLAPRVALYSLELLLASIAAYAAAVWPDRPRGWVNKELVQAGPSQVAGKGVFALGPIPEGTVLGAYPGRPRTPAGMAAKSVVAPGARDYCFRTPDDRLLDPTDATGQLSTSPGPGLPWLPIDVTLAYINEPPKGAGLTNVTVEDDPDDSAGLLCVAARDIYPGEELFMDYGIYYDRSSYGQKDAAVKQDEGRAGEEEGETSGSTGVDQRVEAVSAAGWPPLILAQAAAGASAAAGQRPAAAVAAAAAAAVAAVAHREGGELAEIGRAHV